MDMRQVALTVASDVASGTSLAFAKKKAAKSFGLATIPTNIELVTHLTADEKKEYTFLMTKPVRTVSGVAPIAVMAKPYACKHGRCSFCPGGPGSVFGDVPQSYTGNEPSTMRAARAEYNPYLIVFNRLEQFMLLGQVPEKAEVIIQGGTFPSYDAAYQRETVALIFKALNDFSFEFFVNGAFVYAKFKDFFELPGSVQDAERTQRVHKKILALQGAADLALEQQRNETATIRCVGLTIETKPDWGFASHGQLLLDLGCTRIELGVQSVYDEVLAKTNRGHTLADTHQSLADLKDLGFKINAHYMLGLYVDAVKDLAGLRELFSSALYRPDMLKIYPCLIMPGTPLYELWERGEFTAISWQDTAALIAEFKKDVPSYLRIHRIQRDIPSTVISAGPIRTNLRQEVAKLCEQKGITCNCIRCREPGRCDLDWNSVCILVEKYEANGGVEFFISAEDKDRTLVGYARLRFPGQFLRSEITLTSALLRELHVYGPATSLGAEGSVQHKGWGQKLMAKAEAIASEHGKDKVVVISGIGVRRYYADKLGYRKEGPYMVKQL